MGAYSFDIHGVLDDLPSVFVDLANALYDAGHEIHIVTGSAYNESIGGKLHELGIKYHKYFSITEYCLKNNIQVTYDEKGDPWIDVDIWNKAKAIYCAENKIDLHFDDSDIYHQHFTTPYARVYTKNNRGGEHKPIIR